MRINRRDCLKRTGIVAAGMLGLQHYLAEPLDAATSSRPFGAPQPDPAGLIDLPDGFRYQVISTVGQLMDDGLLVPGLHDGMAALPGPNGTTILIRNHELDTGDFQQGPFGDRLQRLGQLDREHFYDFGSGKQPACGGTTTLVYDTRRKKLLSHFLSLTGTLRNCSGGPTPWGSWLTCEETAATAQHPLEQDHGYVFEVPATTRPKLAAPIAFKAMGRFRREAVAIDDRTGIVYQTEDLDDGLLYRFLPAHPGRLVEGGRLQALCIREHRSADTRNWPEISPLSIRVGDEFQAQWIDIDNVESPTDDLRLQGHVGKGAAIFARSEGIWYEDGTVFFACTKGGANGFGQIWRYRPSEQEGQPGETRSPGSVELFVEPADRKLLSNADNLTFSPWGDLIACEDTKGHDRLVGITSTGQMYPLARNAFSGEEFAGCAFSPDGSTMFVNIQDSGITLAITGPWRRTLAPT